MVSGLPTDDTFDHGTDDYGTFVLGYLGWEPKAAVDAGNLVWSSQVGSGQAWAIGEESIATNDDVPVAFMRRQEFPEDVSVRAAFRFVATAGTPDIDHGHELGVFARATAGTKTDDGTEFVHYVNGDGYGLLFTRTGTDAYDLQIVRWSGGVETQLAVTQLVIYAPTLATRVMRLRLDVYTNTSGNVELSAWVQNLKAVDVTPSTPTRGTPYVGTGQFGMLDVLSTWEQISSVTDSSGSKITGGGRCGFVMEREREYGAGATRVVTAVGNFAVKTIEGGALFSDGFTRAAPGLARTFTDAWGGTATSLASDFTNDLFSAEQDASDMLRRDTSTEEATQNPTASVGNAIDLVPATSDYISLDLSDTKYTDNIPLRASTLFSWTAWANIDTNATGNIFFDDFLDLGNGSSIGMTLGLKPGVGANTYRMFAKVSSESSGSGATYETADIPEVGMLSTTTHFAWTISAVDNRVRFYVNGSLSVERAMTENPKIRGASATRVGWNGTAGATTANYLDGRLDELRLYWVELTANEVTRLATPSAVGASIDVARLLHGWTLDSGEFVVGVSFGYDGNYLATTYGETLPVALSATLMGSAASTTGIANAPRTRALYATQRPVDDTRTQHRAVTVKLADVNQTAGVFVRAGFTSGSDFTGYRADVRANPDGVVSLYRVRAGVETLIASVADSIALATQYEVRLQVSDATVGDPSGSVYLAVYIDGTQAVLVASGASGVFSDASGTVRDAAATRITSGALEGFHGLTPGGTAVIDFDLWRQDYLDELLFQAIMGPSVALKSEVDGVTGNLNTTLGIEPTLPLRRVLIAPADVGEYESGHDVRSLRTVAARRSFRPVYEMDSTLLATFRTFFAEHGTEIPFTWTPERETQGVFAFSGTQFTAEPLQPDWWRVSFDVMERISPNPVAPALATPAEVPGGLFWCSAQKNVRSVSGTPPESGLTKTPTALGGGDEADRVYNATLNLPETATNATLGQYIYALQSVGTKWALVQFASSATINGKRTLESRQEDQYYFATAQGIPYFKPWWSSAGFTFMAHIIPPTSGYGASEYIVRLTDVGADEMLRIGWTTSQFYLVAGVAEAGRAISGYDLGSLAVAKAIVVRWSPGSKVELFDGGGTANLTPNVVPAMTAAAPIVNVLFQSSTTEGTAVSPDADVGTRLFVQDVAWWSRALSDAEVNAVGAYWSAQYGSTWTDLA